MLLGFLCTYVETQNPNMETAMVAVYYGMSVDSSRRILRHVRLIDVLL